MKTFGPPGTGLIMEVNFSRFRLKDRFCLNVDTSLSLRRKNSVLRLLSSLSRVQER